MRKNTARHWLHATLDLLPVILIPVFMIYSHRHDLSTDITIQQDVYKDFYQGVKNGKPNNLDDISSDNVEDLEIIDNSLSAYVENNDGYFDVFFDFDFEIKDTNEYYLTFDIKTPNNQVENSMNVGDNNDAILVEEIILLNNGNFNKYSYLITPNYDVNESDNTLYFNISSEDLFGWSFYFKNVMLFDLTEIFGSGNEPTKEVFESYLTQDYYDFGSNEVKVGTIDVQAKNNDIMSVFMDSFNNSVNKYFNMGNVFNLNNVYEWFNANLFGGNAPVVIYSVYNIVVYELVMDLLFLLYALFMWFIDMLKRLIEKPLDSIK